MNAGEEEEEEVGAAPLLPPAPSQVMEEIYLQLL